jgi:hypothetical protein
VKANGTAAGIDMQIKRRVASGCVLPTLYSVAGDGGISWRQSARRELSESREITIFMRLRREK